MNIDYSRLPEHMREGTRAYIEEGRLPGDFLQAVICNNLADAVGRADHINKHLLPEWVLFFYNEVPRGCWGSKDKMRQWIADRSGALLAARHREA